MGPHRLEPATTRGKKKKKLRQLKEKKKKENFPEQRERPENEWILGLSFPWFPPMLWSVCVTLPGCVASGPGVCKHTQVYHTLVYQNIVTSTLDCGKVSESIYLAVNHRVPWGNLPCSPLRRKSLAFDFSNQKVSMSE